MLTAVRGVVSRLDTHGVRASRGKDKVKERERRERERETECVNAEWI